MRKEIKSASGVDVVLTWARSEQGGCTVTAESPFELVVLVIYAGSVRS